MEYLWLLAGFVLLIVGADIFVEGSSALAKSFKIPTIIIGLTVVAFGTSMPEASVSISAALTGKNDIAISNVIGSNIFNLLVVLGASALICPVKVTQSAIKKEIPFSIITTVLIGALLIFGVSFVDDGSKGALAFWNAHYTLGLVGGIILLAFFAFYMYWQIGGAIKARKSGEIKEDATESGKQFPLIMSIEMIILGLVGIIMGGNYVVDNACIIAARLGMSEQFIGLTIVAIGTSLPELVTSVVAAKKGESDIALGNVIGSNIFNIVFILGASALLAPMTVNVLSIVDTVVLLAISIMSLFFAKTQKLFSRKEGLVMVAIYVAYFVYLLVR
ncbi:MAG: calcium/sodium antiporter [Clostridia bacterium]|nr:calcium/sodium antiporter [Clostridia bacterium]